MFFHVNVIQHTTSACKTNGHNTISHLNSIVYFVSVYGILQTVCWWQLIAQRMCHAHIQTNFCVVFVVIVISAAGRCSSLTADVYIWGVCVNEYVYVNGYYCSMENVLTSTYVWSTFMPHIRVCVCVYTSAYVWVYEWNSYALSHQNTVSHVSQSSDEGGTLLSWMLRFRGSLVLLTSIHCIERFVYIIWFQLQLWA